MKSYAVFFDLDSTLVTIEGLDWIAEKKGVGERMKAITNKAMNGEISMNEALKEKMSTIAPSRDELIKLGKKYTDSFTEGVQETISSLQKNNITVGIVTGSFTHAAFIVGDALNIPQKYIFANEAYFFEDGKYKGYDENCPLAKNGGKGEIIKRLRPQFEEITFVGDGITDLETLEYVTQFIGFGGVAQRSNVKEKAKIYVESSNLKEILAYIIQ